MREKNLEKSKLRREFIDNDLSLSRKTFDECSTKKNFLMMSLVWLI